ncbi:MAG TPA: electron transport complex subunit E [Bacteroidales bacterium]|nr:electron transport complex subunit E [Bacteroidales bacterium]
MNNLKNFTKGFIKENPVLVLFLGLCPTLGTSNSAINGLSMGLATTFVLVLSNLVISSISKFIPDKVRIPAYIVVIASFVTVVDFLMKAYLNTPGKNFEPSIYDQLGIFIPLIVVNCIVLGRAEAYASKNPVKSSMIDGLGMGLGFASALFVLGSIRELLGNGSILGFKFISGDGMLMFVSPPGAFLALGFLIMLMRRLNQSLAKN